MSLESIGIGLEDGLQVSLLAERDPGLHRTVDWSWQYLEGPIAAQAEVGRPAVAVADAADAAPFDLTRHNG